MEVLEVALSHPPRALASTDSEAGAGLGRALRALGHETTVVVPFHREYSAAGLLAAKRLTPLSVLGEEVGVFEAQLPSGIHLVLLDVAGELEDGVSPDGNIDGPRAALLGRFARATVAYIDELSQLGRAPDAIHAHGAEAGLCLLGLSQGKLAGVAKVLSVHDALVSGKVDSSLAGVLGIPESLATAHSFGMGDQLCLLKGLLGLADRVVVPSQAYARALCSPERLGALARAFSTAQPVGIFDGVDIAVYNPATDSRLVARFDAADPSPKGVCKAALQGQLELEIGAERPLIYAEPTEESEVQSILSALPGVVRQDAQLLLSLPRPVTERERELVTSLASQVRLTDPLTDGDRRRALSGADFFLSLRKTDPAGQELRQAMRYGAIPLALEVDSVPDHVIDCDAQLSSGSGFLMDAPTQRALISGVGRCVSAHRHPAFDALRKRAMRRDVSWDRPSRQMVQLYKKLAAAQA